MAFALAAACVLLMAAGCTHGPVALSGPGLPPRAATLAEDVGVAKRLVSRSLEWRGRSVRYIEEMQPRFAAGVLTSADLQRLYTGAEDYVGLRRRWQALQDIQGEEAWRYSENGAAMDVLQRVRLKLVLAAALMQYDDFHVGVEPYFEQTKTRRLLKQDRPALTGELDASIRHFLDPRLRLTLARAVVWHRANAAAAVERGEDERFLDEVIGQSASYVFFTRGLAERLLAEWRLGGHAGVTFVTDMLVAWQAEATRVGSMAVGNTVGLVELRSGYLRALTKGEREVLAASLEPLDVLFEKTPFRLTDKSIPGHYGHVAVWVGGERELRELGLWEDPLVQPHHAQIRAGACIIEALRPGVEINTLEHFLNIDDFLAIRPVGLTLESRRASLRAAFAQLGKAYDFNFDVETDLRIVCSELAFVVFPEREWTTSKVLGRASITPDQVAEKGLDPQQFFPVLLYHDGVRVTGRLRESLQCLLRGDLAAFRALHPSFKGRSE